MGLERGVVALHEAEAEAALLPAVSLAVARQLAALPHFQGCQSPFRPPRPRSRSSLGCRRQQDDKHAQSAPPSSVSRHGRGVRHLVGCLYSHSILLMVPTVCVLYLHSIVSMVMVRVEVCESALRRRCWRSKLCLVLPQAVL